MLKNQGFNRSSLSGLETRFYIRHCGEFGGPLPAGLTLQSQGVEVKTSQS